MIERQLRKLEGSPRLIRVWVRGDDTPYLATVTEVDASCVRLDCYQDDTMERWGDVILRLGDVYRIDLFSLSMERWRLDRCLGLERPLEAKTDGGEDDHAAVS